MRWAVLLVFISSGLFVHWRGKVRHGVFRQLSDHSTLMGPLNCFAYLFSRVPTTPFVEPAHFTELDALRNHWEMIRDEAIALRDAQRICASGRYNDIGFNSFFRRGWKRFYLKWYNDAHPSAATLCPHTTALLRTMPSVKAAMFAELPPGGELMPHRDPYAGSLRYHLGLATPNDDGCWIEVDGTRYSWRDGQAVMFDETYIHRAANETQTDRIILFCDVERPMKYRWAAWFMRALGGSLMRAATSPNDAGDRTGGLNHAFRYLYAIRRVGKRIKAWNRKAYYAIKWLLFGGIALLVFIY